jgi:putative SbcD/Mre11-related phosphoesterase
MAEKRPKKRAGTRAAHEALPANPVAGERALLFSPKGGPRALVVGDLHIGIETDYAFGGVKIPSATQAIVRRLKAIQTSTGATKLVIAGDLKHSVQTITRQEEEEVPESLAALSEVFDEVVVVPGNHDGNAERLVQGAAPNVRLTPVGGELLRGGLLVIHGHAWPDRALAASARGVALAHNHTAVALEDSLGRVTKEPCWARGRVNPERWREATGADTYPEVILMPPFNELCTGVALNLQGVRPIGPLLREGCIDLPRFEVFLLDGAMLGTVASLTLALQGDALRRVTRGASEDQ